MYVIVHLFGLSRDKNRAQHQHGVVRVRLISKVFVVYCTGKRTSRKLAEKEVFCRHPEMLSEIVVFGSWQPC